MDWQTIGSIIGPLATMLGLMWLRIDKKFDAIDKRFDEIYSDLREIRNDIKELRTSLNRMEGAFYSKDCCMLKDDKQNKKAE